MIVRSALLALLLALVLGTSAAVAGRIVPAPAPGDTAVAVAAHPAAYTPPAERLLFNDPVRHPGAITTELVRLVDGAEPGSSIEVSTFFLRSTPLIRALDAAFARGVRVRVLLTRLASERFGPTRALAERLNADRDDTSWLRWTHGSARGTAGVDHQKIWRFSEVGGRRWVTVVGSMNASDLADRTAYSQMLLVSRRDVYDAFGGVFRQASDDRPVADPVRRFAGPGWTGYAFPTTARTPEADPVVRRLDEIPGGPGTDVRIAMYSMWDARGLWIAQRLAALSRAGARVSVIVGPPVSGQVLAVLAAGGVRVHGGCWPDGRYTHTKDMSASFEWAGRRRTWTWVGSDNWTSNGQLNDEAVLGVDSPAVQRAFLRDYAAMWSRRGAVMPSACHPRRD
jgi:phosphatidylserine/phosphatidylglycerophosphate/cardiolipin synthase-like enzyme